MLKEIGAGINIQAVAVGPLAQKKQLTMDERRWIQHDATLTCPCFSAYLKPGNTGIPTTI